MALERETVHTSIMRCAFLGASTYWNENYAFIPGEQKTAGCSSITSMRYAFPSPTRRNRMQLYHTAGATSGRWQASPRKVGSSCAHALASRRPRAAVLLRTAVDRPLGEATVGSLLFRPPKTRTALSRFFFSVTFSSSHEEAFLALRQKTLV